MSLEIALISALIFAGVHLLGTRLSALIERDKAIAGALGGGIAVSFVFLELMPKLDHGHENVGELIEFVVLGGFVVVYALTRFAHQEDGPRHGVFFLKLGISCSYNWLLVYSFPRSSPLQEMAASALLVSHLLFSDHALRKLSPAHYDRFGRWLLALASLSGWATLRWVGQPNPLQQDILVAILAGTIMYGVFAEELPNYKDVKFRWFLAGVVIYLSLFLLA